MKPTNKIIILAVIAVVFSFSILGAQAGDPVNLADKLSTVGEAGSLGPAAPNLAKTVGAIIAVALTILGVIFMAYIVYAGYLWLIARGNDEQVTKAKAIIRGSIIGLIIVLGAYAISAFVVSRLIVISLAP